MKKTNRSKFIISAVVFITMSLISCNNEIDISTKSNNFNVKLANIMLINDTVFVNVNDTLNFAFDKTNNPAEILFYSGESQKEFRFASRSQFDSLAKTNLTTSIAVQTSVTAYDNATASDFSLQKIENLSIYSADGLSAATHSELKKLRVGVANSSNLTETFVTTNPQQFSPILNLALIAKSANAVKNQLQITSFTVLSSEIRNYGYFSHGLNLPNTKTINYTNISATDFVNPSWAQFAPVRTFPPNATTDTTNASGYSWNTGEIGVSYKPDVTGGTVKKNQDSLALATTYPLGVKVPGVSSGKQVPVGIILPSEAWLISRPVNLCALTPDAGTVIKTVIQNSISNYPYVYKEVGVYKSSFVGFYMGSGQLFKNVREFIIVVKNKTDNIQ